MPTLMGHLAQFSSFTKQGELLCTQGLAYLLRNEAACKGFLQHLYSGKKNAPVNQVYWHAERCQEDGGRPDLEACTADGTPFVKIEGKLGADLSEAQLGSYAADLQKRAGGGLLVVVVPRYRLDEANTLLSKIVAAGPFCELMVMSWDDVLKHLDQLKEGPFASELEQFRDLYRAVSGDVVLPPAESSDWREREPVYLILIDKATRRLSANPQVLPFGKDAKGTPEEYQRRYVCRSVGATSESCFSIGLREPPLGHTTPFWLRFHKDTGAFAAIRSRILTSSFSAHVIVESGHLWFPIELPTETDGELLTKSLVAQAQAIVAVAYAQSATLVEG